MDGYLDEVITEPLGSTVATAAAAGAGTLVLDASTDFAEDGGTIGINGQVVHYATAVYAEDNESLTLTFEAGETLAIDAAVGDTVALLNADETQAEAWTAMLDVSGADFPIDVDIPLELRRDFLPGDAQAGAMVTYESDGQDGYRVTGKPTETPLAALVPTAPPDTELTVKAAGDAGGITGWATPTGQVDGTTLFNWYLNGELVETTQSLVYRFKTEDHGLTLDTDYVVGVEPTNDVGGSGTIYTAAPVQLDTAVSAETVMATVVAGLVMTGAIEVGLISLTPPSEDDSGGLKIPLTNGGLVHIPADGSDVVLAGVILNALRIVVEEFELLGLGTISGILEIASGTTAPSAAPRGSTTWDHPDAVLDVAIDGSAGNYRGLYDDGATFVSLVNLFGGTVFTIDKATGAIAYPQFPDQLSTSTAWQPFGGVTKAGTHWYVLGIKADFTWSVREYDATWTLTNEWAVPALNGDNLGEDPHIACDSGSTDDIYIARMAGPPAASPADPNRFIIRRFNSAGVQQGSATTVNTSETRRDLTGFYVGSADAGAGQTRLVLSTVSRNYVFNGSFSRLTSEEWSSARGYSMFGMTYDATTGRFVTLAATAEQLYFYGKTRTATVRSLTSTLRDSVGGIETDASPARSYTQPARSWMRIDVDPLPASPGTNEPDSVRFYIDDKKQADLAAGVTFAIYDVPDTSGAAAPTSNGFLGLTAAGVLRSFGKDSNGDPITELLGTGQSRLGDITVTEDGVANVTRELVSASTTATSGNITTESLRLATGVFKARAGQRYKIRATITLRNNTAGGRSTVKLKWDTAATGTGGTIVLTAQFPHPASNTADTRYYEGEFLYSGTDEADTYAKVTVEGTNGTTVADAATFGPGRLSVDAIA